MNDRPRTTIELLLEYVVPFIGAISMALILRSCSPLPRWACIVIAIPVGTIGGWLVVLGPLVLLDRMIPGRSRGREPPDEQTDEREPE